MAEISTLPLKDDANLKAYYRLSSGSLTTDSGSNGYTLTNNNTVGESNIKFGGSADFGSSNTNKALDIDSNLGITGGNYSSSCWIKLNTEISSGNWTFVAQSDGGINVRFQLDYEYNGGTRRLGFYRVRNDIVANGAFKTITLGTSDVYHLVLTYDGSNVRGYINGVLEAGPTSASGNGGGSGHSGFAIGAAVKGSNITGELENFSSSNVDDVAIFNKTLSQTEIDSIFEAGPTAGRVMIF